MLSPRDSRRGRLLEKYVRARIVDMTGIDIGLYDYDRHSSIYFFAVSPDEQIYLRYGGRDARGVGSYLDLESITLALEAGLEQHERWKKGALPRAERPAPRFPREIETLRTTEMNRGRCVECHMISDYEAAEKEAAGTLDKPQDMFRSPDVRNIGIHLDVPRGLVLAKATGAAAAAGMRAGDTIVALAGTRVLTFGDFLYAYDRVDRTATSLTLAVERGADRTEMTLRLPPLWWVYDLSFRRWSIDPVTHFTSVPLSTEQKAALGLREDGFACEVTRVSRRTRALGTHTLEPGDVVYSVGGVETDSLATSCHLYIQLNVRAGDSVELGVLRNGEKMTTNLNTHRQHYRQSIQN